MWKLAPLNKETDKPGTLFEKFEHYVHKKNLNFLVARGKCLNLRPEELGKNKVTEYLSAYATCNFSMIALFNQEPKPPFIAADMDIDKKIARVQFLIDFNEEVTSGRATPFYSKVLGAFATNFFTAQPRIRQLWFPFAIENIVGSQMNVKPGNSGSAILR